MRKGSSCRLDWGLVAAGNLVRLRCLSSDWNQPQVNWTIADVVELQYKEFSDGVM
jgi:hypothetical protein